MSEQLVLTPRRASELLGITVQTLARWRVTGAGPAFLKLGSRVRYDRRDLDEWLAKRRFDSTSAATVIGSPRGSAAGKRGH